MEQRIQLQKQRLQGVERSAETIKHSGRNGSRRKLKIKIYTVCICISNVECRNIFHSNVTFIVSKLLFSECLIVRCVSNRTLTFRHLKSGLMLQLEGFWGRGSVPQGSRGTSTPSSMSSAPVSPLSSEYSHHYYRHIPTLFSSRLQTFQEHSAAFWHSISLWCHCRLRPISLLY